MTLIERLLSKVEKKENGCWEWIAHRTTDGYGRVWFRGKKRLAHKVMYLLVRGILPEGLELDHLCRNRACINPEHLEPVTHQENVLRGNGLTAINARKTHCPHGHEYTPENTETTEKTGARWCIACRRIRQRKNPRKVA